MSPLLYIHLLDDDCHPKENCLNWNYEWKLRDWVRYVYKSSEEKKNEYYTKTKMQIFIRFANWFLFCSEITLK